MNIIYVLAEHAQYQTQFQFLADYLFTLEIVINFNQSHIFRRVYCESKNIRMVAQKRTAFLWYSFRCTTVDNNDMMIFRVSTVYVSVKINSAISVLKIMLAQNRSNTVNR